MHHNYVVLGGSLHVYEHTSTHRRSLWPFPFPIGCYWTSELGQESSFSDSQSGFLHTITSCRRLTGQKALLRISLTHKSERLARNILLLNVGTPGSHQAGAGAGASLFTSRTVEESSLGRPRSKLRQPISVLRSHNWLAHSLPASPTPSSGPLQGTRSNHFGGSVRTSKVTQLGTCFQWIPANGKLGSIRAADGPPDPATLAGLQACTCCTVNDWV